jgi:hypothetical protein
MDRLCKKGMIDNPRSKAKSVVLTEEGLAESAGLFDKLFGRADAPARDAATPSKCLP